MKKKQKSKPKNKWGRVMFNFFFAVIAISIIIIIRNNILLATILEILLGFIGLFVWKSKITTTVFIMGGLWGSLIEIAIMSNTNAWAYTAAGSIGVFPFWMIVIWANAASFIYETTKELKKLK